METFLQWVKTKVIHYIQFVPDMIAESLDTKQKIGSELNVELAEVSVGGESLGRKWKTGEKKVRFEEDFDETTAIEENTIQQVGKGSPLENIVEEEGLVEELEITNVSLCANLHEDEDDEVAKD